MVAARTRYARRVFINCPFDEDYVPIFEAIVFSIQALGFEPVSARIRMNSGEVRLLKIASLIRSGSAGDPVDVRTDHAGISQQQELGYGGMR